MSEPLYALVGAGPVGTGLARALVEAGCRVAGIASRKPASARLAAEYAGVPCLGSIEEVRAAADWIFIATPDAAVEDVAASLGADFPGVVCHLSGALPAAVLSCPRALSMHPCASLPDADTAFQRLRSCWYGLEGDAPWVQQGGLLAARLGARSFVVSGNKALYHAGACVASNYLVTLAAAAQDMWERAGVPDEARGALLDLMEGTLDNLRRSAPRQALTGPLRRGDTATVLKHLGAMREYQVPWSELYRSMGRETLKLAPHEALDALLKDADE